MAKPKPTEIIRHEIVLGAVEREILEGFATGSTLNSLLKTLIAVGGTAASVGALATLLELMGFIDLTGKFKGWADEVKEGVYQSGDEALGSLVSLGASVVGFPPLPHVNSPDTLSGKIEFWDGVATSYSAAKKREWEEFKDKAQSTVYKVWTNSTIIGALMEAKERDGWLPII